MRRFTHFSRPIIVFAAILLLILLLYLVLSLVWRSDDPQYAPDITGVTADGTSLFSLSDNRGETGTVLIFFDPETGKAVELMQQLSTAVEGYEVDVVAVAVGAESVEGELALMEEQAVPVFSHTLFDLDGAMAEAYNISAAPITYFIDKNGLVQDVFISSISEKSLQKALASIA